MNQIEEIKECIKDFICEKKQTQCQISEIENKRIQLAKQRNDKKRVHSDWTEIDMLGKQIAELGCQSQELQNKLDFKVREKRYQIYSVIENLIVEGIRKIRRLNEEIQELEENIASQKERNIKYQIQKQEFCERFGRMPELSEEAIEECKRQEENAKQSIEKIEKLKVEIENIEDEMEESAILKRKIKNGNWNFIAEEEKTQENTDIEPLEIEEIEDISIEEIKPTEELYVEEFKPVEELHIQEFEPVEELHIQEFEPVEELHIQDMEPIEELHVQEFNENDLTEICSNNEINTETVKEKQIEDEVLKEIEELAKQIVEEIVAKQTQDINVKKIEEQENVENNIAEPEDIITSENEDNSKTVVPQFAQKVTISNIVIKIENEELVYKALMSNGEEVKIYPGKIEEENVLLRDKQSREECKEILINYTIREYKLFDKKIVKSIDPLVCELLIECSKKYEYDAHELIYNYAMSFSYDLENDAETIPAITYNLAYLAQSNLNKKEKAILRKICKNAKKNNRIEIIENFAGFSKIKYIFRKLLALDNIKALPEGKY